MNPILIATATVIPIEAETTTVSPESTNLSKPTKPFLADPLLPTKEAFDLACKRDEAHSKSEAIFSSIEEKVSKINSYRRELKNYADKAQMKARDALHLHATNVNYRMAELRKSRKGVSLENLDFIDIRSHYFGTELNENILWFGIRWNSANSKESYTADILSWAGYEIEDIKNQKYEHRKIDTTMLRNVLSFSQQLPWRPFLIRTHSGLYSHYTISNVKKIRAYPREAFDDIPHLDDNRLISLCNLIHDANNGYPTTWIK